MSHGRADVERGFSLNQHVVVENLVLLKQRTVVALCTVKDAVTRYESVDKMPIPRDMIPRYRPVYSAYNADLKSTATQRKDDEDAKQEQKIDLKKKQMLLQRKTDAKKEAETLQRQMIVC